MVAVADYGSRSIESGPGGESLSAPPSAKSRSLFEPTDPVYPRLQKCGLLADTMALLLSELAAGFPLEEISRRLSEGSLLSLRSEDGRNNVLAALRVRLLCASRPLPGHVPLSAWLARTVSPLARNQVLLPYLLRGDTATFRLLTRLVLPIIHSGRPITVDEVIQDLSLLLAEERRKTWSPYLQRRWSRGVLSVLRDVGALTREGGREQLTGYDVRPEVLSFHLWGLWNDGYRGRDLFDPAFWKLLLLDEAAAREGVRRVAELRWWRISSIGGVDEVRPEYPTLEEWIEHGLG